MVDERTKTVREDRDSKHTAEQRAFSAVFALLATALACSIVVLYAPRPVVPGQLPALRLDRAAVVNHAEQERVWLRGFERLASDAELQQLTYAYLEEGLVELEPRVDEALVAEQRKQRSALAQRVFVRLGEAAWRSYTAKLVHDAMHALSSDDVRERDSDRARGLLGVFPKLLRDYGYTDARGRLLAPPLSVHAFYQARLNLVFERAVTDGLTVIERQAYEGFNALHAGGLRPEQRALASASFYAAGGRDSAEALGIWLFQGGQVHDALALLGRAYVESHSLAVRNMLLVVREAAE